MTLKEEVLKLYPDFMNYAGFDDVEEWNTLDDYFIYHLEHELDLYYDWKEEGYSEPFSLVQKDKLAKVKRIINNYYKGKYKESE